MRVDGMIRIIDFEMVVSILKVVKAKVKVKGSRVQDLVTILNECSNFLKGPKEKFGHDEKIVRAIRSNIKVPKSKRAFVDKFVFRRGMLASWMAMGAVLQARMA
jgi:hypothetical protein